MTPFGWIREVWVSVVSLRIERLDFGRQNREILTMEGKRTGEFFLVERL